MTEPLHAEVDQIEEAEWVQLLGDVCQAPGCYLLNGEHTPEETAACVERWVLAEEQREAAR